MSKEAKEIYEIIDIVLFRFFQKGDYRDIYDAKVFLDRITNLVSKLDKQPQKAVDNVFKEMIDNSQGL